MGGDEPVLLTAGYNTNLVKPDDVPKTYDGPARSEWKGQIAWTNDPTAGRPARFHPQHPDHHGPGQGHGVSAPFAEQKPVSVPASQRVVLDKVIAGEYPGRSMTFNHHAAISAGDGAPVAWAPHGAAARNDEPDRRC